MNPTLRRLLVAIATFLIGTTAHQFFDRREEASPDVQVEWVRVAHHEPTEPPRPTEPAVIFDYDSTEFNPRGDYYILGRKPKEFREFDCLELAVDDNTYGQVRGQIMIQTYVDEMYAATYAISGRVDNKRIYLVTEPFSEEDVGYRFEGEFLRQGELWRARKSQAVLKGRLTKVKDGRTIAEAVVKFRIEYLGC